MGNMVDQVIKSMLETETDVTEWDESPLRELAIGAIQGMRKPNRVMQEILSNAELPGLWDELIDAALEPEVVVIFDGALPRGQMDEVLDCFREHRLWKGWRLTETNLYVVTAKEEGESDLSFLRIRIKGHK